MDPRSHNLLETYYHDGGNAFHYNSLKSGDNTFRVDFTREVTASGINVAVVLIKGNNDAIPTAEDITFLTQELNVFQDIPHNGDECVTLGWTYVGNKNTNTANVEAAVAECEGKGHKFVPLFYQSGYFVFGCVEDRLFYDNN